MRTIFGAAVTCLFLSFAMPSIAQEAQPQKLTDEQRKAEIDAAWRAGEKAATRGPAEVKLIDQATLKLPAEQLFIPKAESDRIMRAMGNSVGSRSVGLIVGMKATDNWLVTADFIKEGYIKDDDAKTWNADELLANLKSGTEQDNEDRRARGFGELEIIGWMEKPNYDAPNHRLIWSLSAKRKGEAQDAPQTINYNTYALGREGYFSLDLVTSSQTLEADKPAVKTLLSNLTYNSGKAYADFNASTDNVAAYGLAALVGGVALKKLGFLAIVFGFAAKFAKVLALVFFGGLAALRRFFTGKKKDQA